MKIAYLANVRFPSERAHSAQIGHMCQAFAENGNDVTLLANKRTRESLIEVGEKYGFSPQFKMVRLRPNKIFPLISASFVFGEFWFAAQVFLFSGLKQYDLIYTRHEWVVWVLSYFISPEKIVWESHEAKLTFPARRVLRRGIKTIVISDGIEKTYCAYGVPVAQMLVAHDGIDASFFEKVEPKIAARHRLGIPNNKKVAMYIGGFDEWKGMETFFAASEVSNIFLFVAIGGTAKHLAKYQVLYPKVLFLGARPYIELKDNQQAADVLVIPNTAKNRLSSSYTSPLKLFAHMASGVPLVVSDIPSLTQVTPDDLVTKFRPDDAADLASKIKMTQTDYHSKKENATELIQTAKQYTWTKRAQSITIFYATCA
jgi:glycosyltransferase involved in cell wall biosynthesis